MSGGERAGTLNLHVKLVPNNSTSYAFFSKLVCTSRHWDAMELIFGLVLVHTIV